MMMMRRLVTSTVLLITMVVMNVPPGHTLMCRDDQYEVGNKCCPMCLPGCRVKTDCIGDIPTSCRPCLMGTFMDKINGEKYCNSCTNCNKGSGLKTKDLCTTKSDTVCEPLEGFYCVAPSDNNCDAAEKHKSCKPGQYISKNGTASSDTECSDCSQGTFSDGSFTSCRPHTQCDNKKLRLLEPGTTSTDAQCEEQLDENKLLPALIIPIVALFLVAISFVYCFKQKKLCFKRQREVQQTVTNGDFGSEMGRQTRQNGDNPSPKLIYSLLLHQKEHERQDARHHFSLSM